MRTRLGCRRRFVIGVLAFILAGLASGRAGAQADLEQLEAEIAKAWKDRDFARVEAAGRKYLAAVPSPVSPGHITSFMCISGAETVAGRTNDAADHFIQTVDYIARLTCQTQSPQHKVLAALISQFLQHMPPGSRGKMQVMLNEVWEAVSEKGRKRDTLSSTYQGFSTLIAAGLAQLYYLSGADSVARTYAGEAILSAPSVEVAGIPYESDNVCGCIKIVPFKEFRGGSDGLDFYLAYIRAKTHSFTHPPRALALLAGIEIFMKTRDDTRLRRAAFALEELRDRSLTSGSLNGWPWLSEQIDALYRKLKEQYSQIWPEPKTRPPIPPAEADSDPRLGKTGPAYTKKYVTRYRGMRGNKFSSEFWPILVKASIPAQPGKAPSDKPWIEDALDGMRPLNATPQAGAGRVAVDRPWWLYALEDGQLRVVGRALAWSAGDRHDGPWELKVTRLALGDLWSLAAGLDKEDIQEALKLLGPVYASQELLGPDFEDLPPHRQKMFLQGLPWIGMSARLMRINLHYCDKFMRNWKNDHWKFQPDLTIKGSTWTLTVRGGRVVDVIWSPSGTN